MSGVEGPILVWGAGAIGGTVGAYLTRAGLPVTFVDIDSDHVDAINAGGLAIEGPIEQFSVKAPAFTPDMVEGRFGCILLCVKAHHTRGAAEQLRPHLAPGGYVASFQNGLNELEIAEVVGRENTVGAFVNFGADYMSPGVVQYSGRGAVVIGEIDGAVTPRVRALHETMRLFEPNAVLTDNVMGYLWGKLGYGALLFATALTNASICEALDAREPRALFRRVAGEATAVAGKLGIQPLGFNGYDPAAFAPGASDAAADASFDAMVAHNAKSAKTHSGIWRDLAVRKRKTEADAQLGPIVTFGRQVGVAAPATAGVIAMIHEIEDGRRPLAWDNLAELATSLPPA
ncbi:2-dehydropantoate 2-reductase [Alsobacter soli]|uniref:2-dehydropantoate 2-reductase n=1 Tax=Alsobacter soli TaxID=2109933 RepID=A0A2T1HMF8_9HYPH|nr:ketopantoate reductase family protein [Alsobacter soli]PSC02827.1 2-dehydropantoate 2-reductase [Alsobacter soli]